MNKKLTLVSCISLLVFSIANVTTASLIVAPLIASAQESVVGGKQEEGGVIGSKAPNNTGIITLQNPLKATSITGLVKSFVEIFSYIAILFAVLVLIYIGFRYVYFSAQGNASEIAKLHSWLLWTVVGVAIVIGARVIIEIVINTLQATGTIKPEVFDSARNALKP